MSDREYAPYVKLPQWLRNFANKELKKEGTPFEDIRDLFNLKNDVELVEAKVQEIRDRVGLDKITKESFFAEDQIPGGLADGKEDKDFKKKQLEKGIKVEMEHTDDAKLAKEIVKDHLAENSNYYDHLEKMEKEMEESEPEIFSKHPKFKDIIENALNLRGGHIDVPAVLELVMESNFAKKENIKFSFKDKEELKDYIRNYKNSVKQVAVEEEPGVVIFVIDETFDDDKMFDK